MAQPLPLFTSEAFPDHLINYKIPIFRAPRGTRPTALFSVDWEKDHGRWRTGLEPSYRGIRTATGPLCEMLDRLQIPCTWFVEANSRHSELDMIRSCPEDLAFLATRPQDEVGLHIHWGNFFGGNGEPRSLQEREQWAEELKQSTQRLADFVHKPIASFRSGGHTLVPGLPTILQSLGYRADLSVEDRRRPLFRYLSSLLGFTSGPYRPDATLANQKGDLDILEIPTSLHLHDFDRLESKLSRFLVPGRNQVLSLYIHIDELTRPQTSQIDPARLRGVEKILLRLQSLMNLEFRTVTSFLAATGPAGGSPS